MAACTSRRPAASTTGLLLLAVLAGCSGPGTPPTPRPGADTERSAAAPERSGTVITQEEIQAMGVRTALEALERAGTSLVIQRTRAGDPARIYHRGRDSLLLNAEVRVAVDGSLVQDGVRALESIPAGSVVRIQILSAREGALIYGAAAGNGVIVVVTSAGD